jgi:hypothetical protein
LRQNKTQPQTNTQTKTENQPKTPKTAQNEKPNPSHTHQKITSPKQHLLCSSNEKAYGDRPVKTKVRKFFALKDKSILQLGLED